MAKFYLSTSLPYVNSVPHLGHALEFTQADVIARYHRLLGEDVFFLSGADENALKNVRAAIEAKMGTRDFVDKNALKFLQLKERDVLNLSLDDFIRTTEGRHKKGAQKLWQACKKDIYKKKYKGLYCVGCEEFYKENELENGLCPEHKVKPDLVEEENYFFKLSEYQEQLEKIIEKDKVKIVPETRKNEILSFIKSGLQDFCISRSAERAHGWGVEVPGDPTQYSWVWFDALSNYINALGYAENSKKFQEWWQENENKMHVMGKGIIRFHAVYWLAMLLSAKISLPKIIFVHGYITSGGQKMSKSLGNVIDPFELVKKYGTDAVRYFLLREIPSTEDGDFTEEKFIERYNADLAGGLGNLVARVSALNPKLQIINSKQITNTELQTEINKTRENYTKALVEFKFNEALIVVWELISFCDKYIEKEKPWSFDPAQDKEKIEEVIGDLLSAINEIAKLLEPFLPETSERIIKGENKSLFPRLS
ncbi:MAG: methionine--tRNA ligase [Candidatus Nealsonbacteria bacterium RIFCSPLOWO2_01_FULL_41_9]|uniref:Methionine--tRNA ligase n=1 Tax=Candidatus Nealsonbacteria bacterium RIFCSPLOWO2_01_FULL_41_9 TaxID=1801671 RepID=A0A1G2ECR4_9BACT|nr:MAG: methionine--tRNA ligase [Candidatus Nealsonbacteria bacterium RIFCSPLOWO2_01_FULL_41_9]